MNIMELADYSVADPPSAEANLSNLSLSLSEHLSPSEAPIHPILHGLEVTEGTAQNSSLELKLDLYVPAHPLIEPISPADGEQCAFPIATQETSSQLETADITGFTFKTIQVEQNSDTLTEAACEPAPDSTSSSECSATLQVCVSVDPTHSNETPIDCVGTKEALQGTQNITSDPALSKQCETNATTNTNVPIGCTQDSVRKNIPPKKNKFAPLKIDVIPLTSSQLSLQCLDCHIIFKDSKSKERHIKISHPAEYAQYMLGDSLFACYVCDQHFTCSADLRAHQSTHTETDRFRCPLCNEAFRRSCDLTSHKKIHFSKQGYTCMECNKSCKTLTLLKYHQRVHTGEKPYICLQKHCAKRFCTSKSLLKHLEKHEENDTEGAGDQKKALTAAKKRRNKGTNEWKFKCSQCDAVFKTSKTQLLHMKNKHPQVMESQSSILSVPHPLGPFITTAGRPQTLPTEAVSIPHQTDMLDPEQIKRLIEKFENVKKVNQMVILPFQTNLQPLHLDFTQSTVQPSECKLIERDLSTVEQNKHPISSEVEDLQEGEIVGLSQEEKTIISSENSDSTLNTETTPVVLTEAQTQIDEIHLELIPIQTETLVFLDQTPLQEQVSQNDSVSEQAHAADIQRFPVTQDNLALDKTKIPLTPLTETVKSHNVEEENAVMTNAITVSEEVSNADTLCSGQIQDSTDLESDLHVCYGQNNMVKITFQEFQEQIQAQKHQDNLEKELQEQNQAQKDEVDSDLELQEQNQAQKDQVNSEKELQEQNQDEKDQVISKKDLHEQNQTPKDQVNSEKGPSIVEPQSQTEHPPLRKLQNDHQHPSTDLQLKPRNKTKTTKQKIMTKPNKAKQNPNQQKSEQDNEVAVMSKRDKKVYFKKKVQKDKKGKGTECKSEVEVKSLCQTNDVKDKVSVVPQATQPKPQKRKMKNQHNVIKKAKIVKEDQQDETLAPVQKKKKQSKASQEDFPKKSTVRKTSKNNFHTKVGKTQKNDLQKNTPKRPKNKVSKSKCIPDAPDQAQIEQQVLLLLKGHKQPQLKVHKLDATELEKSPPNKFDVKEPEITQTKSFNVTQQKKTKSTAYKMLCGEPLSLEMSTVESSTSSASSLAKPKILRKRKSPTKIDQEIALSPPYSRLTLGCQDCGKTFSEVSALQEHMAAFHCAEKMAYQDQAIDATKASDKKHIQPNVFEIQVATDWEIGDILGDREEHRLSFPVLSPSPSLTLAAGCVDGKFEETISGLNEPPEKNLKEVCEVATPAIVETIVPQEITETSDSLLDTEASKSVGLITETSGSELKDGVEEEIKEELPLEVNLVMVGEQNEENHSHQINCPSNTPQVHETKMSNPEQTSKNANVSTENVVHCITEPEIKQEEEELLVQKVNDQKRAMGRSSVARGKKGVGRAQSRRVVGKRSSRENRSKKDTEAKKDPQDCQVVYQLCVLDDTAEGNDKEADKNEGNASESCVPPSEESSEDQVVFELDSVTTSVTEVVNSQDGSFIEKSELVRDDRSPGIILEKFLTACERNVEDPNSWNQRRQAMTSACTSADIKIEERSSNQASHSQRSPEKSLMRGVQMFLVKAEEHLALNEPVMFQVHQLNDTHQDKTTDKNRESITSQSYVVPHLSYSKQCIFYPVKEEEREHLVEPLFVDHKCLDSEGLEGTSSGIEECEEMGSVPMEVPHLYTSSEEGDVSEEQQSNRGFLEFLSQNSDANDSDIAHSEPEAETIVMSCYQGIQNNASIGVERPNVCSSQTDHTEAERRLRWKPINYFSQYFSRNTWREIAVCTGEMSKPANPVTEKEVAQYIGIHIAMGTLKFPSIKLYWEDFTRVPLISDAMSASRFCELTRILKIAAAGGPSVETNSNNQCEEMNGEPLKPSNKAHTVSSDTSTMSHSNEEANYCSDVAGSKTDPLWKVMMLIRQVQEGCQALKRIGSFGVDQYPLPFQRHPTHSLLHTVMVSGEGLVVDFNLSIDDSNRETVVEKMVSRGKDGNERMVFLCKPELSTPSMLEHLLEAGVQSAGKVGGAKGQIGDEFVSSDGKLKLFRCHHGFILSAVAKEKPRSTSLVSGFKRAIKAANLNRDLRSLYRTPSTNSAVSAWPQSVLWDLIDMVLVNAWIQYKQSYSHVTDLVSLMAFRLEVAKALILSNGVDAHDSSPPCPPALKQHAPDTNSRPSSVLETPLPDADTRYDGFGHWPEQLAESEEGKCRYGGCERTSRVRCLKCCVFLCISRNHNCFLKFHSRGAS